MNKEQFTKGMLIFLANFRNVNADVKTQEIWFEFLKDLTDKEFELAIGNICKNVKEFYPTTNFVALIRSQFQDNLDNKSMLAWEKVKSAIIEYGYYDSVQFYDPVIHSAINLMGGWLELYELYFKEEKLEWVSKEFCRCYKAMNGKKGHPEYLIGAVEKSNSFKNYDKFIKPPIFISDKEEQLLSEPSELPPKRLKDKNDGVLMPEIIQNMVNKILKK